jgi:hypothetical protein
MDPLQRQARCLRSTIERTKEKRIYFIQIEHLSTHQESRVFWHSFFIQLTYMEVKERQKRLTTYKKQIKKHAKQGRLDELAQAKKEYIQLLLTPVKRELYQKEEEYLQELKTSIRETENKFIELKLDLCYDLHVGLKEFDAYENTLNQMRKKQETILSAKKQRDHQLEKSKKQLQDQRQGIMDSYPFLELEDKKVAYQELEKLSEQMANPTRKVIAYEIENKELEYRLSQLYTPWTDIKI